MKRVWPLRIVQYSPVALLLLWLVVWYSAPSQVRTAALVPEYAGPQSGGLQPEPADPTIFALDSIRNDRAAKNHTELSALDAYSGSGMGFYANLVAGELMRERASLYGPDGSIKPLLFAAGSPVLAGAERYEAKTGGKMIVAIIPGVKNPPVAMKAISSTSLLTTAELAELRRSGTLDTLRSTVRADLSSPTTASAGLSIDAPNNGASGNSYGNRTIMYGSFFLGGHVYEAYMLSPSYSRSSLDTSLFMEWTDLASAQHQQALDTAAQRDKSAIVIIGPVDGAPVLERVPASMTPSSAAELVRLNLAAAQRTAQYQAPFHLSPAMRALAGGKAEWGENTIVAPSAPSFSATDPAQAVYFVGVSQKHPQLAMYWDAVGRGPGTWLPVLVAAHFSAILGAIAMLFAISLVASPIAFVYERRQSEKLDLERERVRVQCEARDRVLERLTRLSERMDRAAASTSGSVGSDISSVAADIDATVAELKRILGDSPLPRGDSDV